MRSLKLSGLIRRNPDRPSLKQRAASLKATAGRVIRSPKSGSPKDLIARAKQHPGMMAYPAERPTSLVAVRFGLRLEAQRLLATALDEFARLYEAQSEGAGAATCRKIEERLKRELRIDALRVAAEDAGPDETAGLMLDLHAMAGGVIHDDGKVSFCDADGRVHRKPVADWVSFTASRLNSVARQEMSRAFNAACKGLTQEECGPIEDRLRRDLRLDALHDLAFRWQDVFETNREYAIGHRWRMPSDEAPKYDLKGCTLSQLARLYESWESLFLHLNASGAIPCFSNDDDLTPAGEILEREYERAGGFLSVIAEEARKRVPAGDSERDERLSVLIRHDLNGNGRIVDPVLLADLATTAEA